MKHAGGKEPKPSAPRPVPREVTGLRVGVLGELTVTHDGRPLNLGGPRPRTLFALLVLARGAVVTCDRLIDAVWDEEPPPSAVGALQAYVSRLRREMEPARRAGTRSGVIVREGAGYAIRLIPDEVDAWRFEALLERTGRSIPSAAERIALLTEALGLWRGPAFTGFEDEPWSRTEATRLAELREVVRERCLAARLERGEHDGAVLEAAEELVGAQPLREERWSLLALAHYRAHGQAEALSVLRRARRTLADRLGIDPGPALRGVEAEVLSHAPRLAAPAPPPESAPASVPSPGLGRLVEREHELEELGHCLSEAVAGRGGLVCVQGPAGIGRSALLTEVGRLGAEWGVRVRGVGAGPEDRAGAAPLPRDPYDVVRQLLGPEVAEHGGLPAAGAPPVSEGQVSDGADGFDVLHGLYRLTERLVTVDEPSRRPLLLLVDDLQACDTASLRFLAHLLPRIQALPILVVTALRTGELPAPPEHEQVLADIAQDPTVVHIRPEPLSAAGVAHLVRRQLGDPVHEEVVHACHRVSVGLPSLLAHVLGALETVEQVTDPRVVEEAGISAVSGLVLARLDRLPSAAGDVVRAIAVLDGGASLPAVAAFAELSELDVASATAVLVRAEVVRDQYPLAFVHPLTAEAVLRAVPQPELPDLRERAAKILDGAGAAPEQTAAHLLLVPYRGDPWVVDVLRTAAARASARGANHAAATLLTRALLEPPTRDVRPEVLLELGRAEALVDGPAAARHLREAYESSPPALGAARLLAQTLIYTGRPGEAAEFAARAAEYPPATQTTTQTAAEATTQTTSGVTSQATSDGTADERQGLLALARLGAFAHGLYTVGADGADVPAPSPLGDGPGARMLAAEAAREATVRGLDRAAAVASARFALTERVLLHGGEILSWCTAGLVLHLAGEDVRLLWDETLTYAEQRGSLIGTLSAHLWKGFTQWRHGELTQARRSLATALEQFGAWGVTPGAPHCRAFLTGVLLDLGDTAAARACLERMRQRSAGAEGARLRAESEARVLIAEGRYGQALAALDGVRQLQPEVVNPVWWDGELLRIRALTGLGERGRAERLAREQLVMARRWGAPGTVGRVLRLLGEARGLDGAAELREALALAADSPSRLEHTRALRSLHAVTCGDNSGDGVVRRFPPV
ncbi:BTAD domain-containing putative transcriptional regulator [Streptomyces sp. NPDC091215]|uniref:BTAD domain-containing putative transcriptional regulator n=1 Tax=Streptomyces sp. NPDC091215 TaxID=3155192 RepID=UPI0034398425